MLKLRGIWISTYAVATNINERMMRNPKVDRVGKMMIRIERNKSSDWLSDDWTPLIAPLWPSSTPSWRICVTVKSASHRPIGYNKNWLCDDIYWIIYLIIYNYSYGHIQYSYIFNISWGRMFFLGSALIYYFKVKWH